MTHPMRPWSRLQRGLLALCLVSGIAAAVVAAPTVASAQPTWVGPILTGLLNPGQTPQMISCPLPGYCVAVDQTGDADVYSGGAWQPATPVSSGFTSVSCVSGTSWCMAVGSGNEAYEYNGTSWTGPTVVFTRSGPMPPDLLDVSCPTTTFCAAVDNQGDAFTWNGSWTEEADIVAGYVAPPSVAILIGLSCSSPTFCVAVDKGGAALGGFAFDWNGSSWSATTSQSNPIDPIGFVAVSCPASSTDCVALDHQGVEYSTTNGFVTSTSSNIDPGDNLASLSCPSAGDCVADDEQGNVLTDLSNTWSAPLFVDTLATDDNFPFTLSCNSMSFCVLVEGGQRVYDYSFVLDNAPDVSITPSAIPATAAPVPYTVTVTGDSITGTPTGSVTVTDSNANTCTISSWSSTTATSATGWCSLTEAATSPPTSVTASYTGNYPSASTTIAIDAAVSNGTSASLSGPPVVTANGGATGTDSVTEAQYPSDPVANLNDGDNYFDVAVTQPSGFTNVVLQDCGVNATSQLSWWDSITQTWDPVVGDPGPTYASGCITVTLDNVSSPTLSQLVGTVFGNSAGLEITTASLPEALVRYGYSVALSAAGGNPPYHWSLTSGSLPAGLRLSSAGVISGTPRTSGTSTFTVKVVDTRPTRSSTQDSRSETLSLAVTQPPPSITSISPDTGGLGGGTAVTIHGAYLEGATSVTFGGTEAERFTVNSAGTTIVAHSPSATEAGPVDVVVTTPGGVSPAGALDVFTYG